MQFLNLFHRYFLLFIGLINLFSKPVLSGNEEKENLISISQEYVKDQVEIYEKYFRPFHKKIFEARSNKKEQKKYIKELIEDFFGLSFSTINNIASISNNSQIEEFINRDYLNQIFIQDQFWSIFKETIEKESLQKQQKEGFKYREQAFIEILIEEIILYMMKSCALTEKTFNKIFNEVKNIFEKNLINKNILDAQETVFLKDIKAIFSQKKSLHLFSKKASKLEKNIQELFSKKRLICSFPKISTEEILNSKLGEKVKRLFFFKEKPISEAEEKKLISSTFPEEELKKLATTLGIKEKFENLPTLEEKLELLAIESFIQKDIEKNIQALFSEKKLQELSPCLSKEEISKFLQSDLEEKVKKLSHLKVPEIRSFIKEEEKLSPLVFPEGKLKKLATTLGVKEKFENLHTLEEKLKLLSTVLSLQEKVFTPAKKMKLLASSLDKNQKIEKEKLQSLFSKKELSLFSSEEKEIIELIKSFFNQNIKKLPVKDKLSLLNFLMEEAHSYNTINSKDNKREEVQMSFLMEEAHSYNTSNSKNDEREEVQTSSSNQEKIVLTKGQKKNQKKRQKTQEEEIERYEDAYENATYLECIPFNEFCKIFETKKLSQISPSFEIPIFLESFLEALQHILKETSEEIESNKIYSDLIKCIKNLLNSLNEEESTKNSKKIITLFELEECFCYFKLLRKLHQINNINTSFWKDPFWSHTLVHRFNDYHKIKKNINDLLNEKTDVTSIQDLQLAFNEKNVSYFSDKICKAITTRAKKIKEGKNKNKKPVKEEVLQKNDESSFEHIHKNITESSISLTLSQREKSDKKQREFEAFYKPYEPCEPTEKPIKKAKENAKAIAESKKNAKARAKAEKEVLQKNDENSSQPKEFFITEKSYNIFTEIKNKIMGKTANLEFSKTDLGKLLLELNSKILNHQKIKLVCFDEKGQITKMSRVYRLDFHHGREQERLDHSIRFYYIQHLKAANWHYAHVYSKKDAPKEDTLTY